MNTVEQEIFATWNFREFWVKTIRVHEIFANFWKVEVFYFTQVIFACMKFSRISRNSQKFPARENLLFYSTSRLFGINYKV